MGAGFCVCLCSVLTNCLDWWKRPAAPGAKSTWESICAHKTPVLEPRESAKLKEVFAEFGEALRGGGGAVFFAVCRGKVSEGLDFADAAGRAVVIVGLPYPNKADLRVKLKREYLDERAHRTRIRFNGGDWYSQQVSGCQTFESGNRLFAPAPQPLFVSAAQPPFYAPLSRSCIRPSAASTSAPQRLLYRPLNRFDIRPSNAFIFARQSLLCLPVNRFHIRPSTWVNCFCIRPSTWVNCFCIRPSTWVNCFCIRPSTASMSAPQPLLYPPPQPLLYLPPTRPLRSGGGVRHKKKVYARNWFPILNLFRIFFS